MVYIHRVRPLARRSPTSPVPHPRTRARTLAPALAHARLGRRGERRQCWRRFRQRRQLDHNHGRRQGAFHLPRPPLPPPRARALAPALGGVQHAYLWPHIVSRDRIGAPPCRDRIGSPAAGGLGSAHVQRQDRRILVQRQDRVARRRRIRVSPCPET